jgi:hypothetical protein
MTAIWRAAFVLALVTATTRVPEARPTQARVTSLVTVLSLDGRKKVVYSTPRKFEAPNWSPDGRYLLLNSEGRLWRLPLAGGEPARRSRPGRSRASTTTTASRRPAA